MPESLVDLYRDHLATVCRHTDEALASAAAVGESYDGIVLHAGSLAHYYADDLEVSFRPTPHFSRFAHLTGCDHFIVYRPGSAPRLIRVVPSSFWCDAAPPLDACIADAFAVCEVADIEAALREIGPSPRFAFIGERRELAARLEITDAACEPLALMAALDWLRAYKTHYEVACIRASVAIAACGHRALLSGIAEGRSERELHLDYLAATGLLDDDLPYRNIIAWDRHAAVLHYPGRSAAAPDPAGAFLVDAGATSRGYACDVTRSYRLADAVCPGADVFGALLDGVDALQRRAVAAVAPGVEYLDLHFEARREIASLLREVGVIRASLDEALTSGIVDLFFPHGLGHHLGLQVHDVGGRQLDREGKLRPPPAGFENLRTTRTLEVDHVVTIEPGIYFIPMLLDPARSGAGAPAIDWASVDVLLPFGGIRIEDDVRVVDRGHEDLSRPQIPGHREAGFA